MAGGGSLSINRPDRLSDREVAPTGYSLILLFNVSGQDAAPTNREKQRLVGSAHPTTLSHGIYYQDLLSPSLFVQLIIRCSLS